MKSAQLFPVGEFIQDELNARGWSIADLAARMGPEEQFDENCLCVELLIHAPEYKGVALPMGDDLAKRIAKAFGTSVELWKNVEKTWAEWLKARN